MDYLPLCFLSLCFLSFSLFLRKGKERKGMGKERKERKKRKVLFFFDFPRMERMSEGVNE